MSFRNHFDMISLNEPVTHKAKFWQSYVRALKGTEDMRAEDARLKLRPRALSEFPELFGRSLFDDNYSTDPNSRISAPGYRYLPISRETYGYSPRPIYGPIDRPRYTSRPSSVPPELDVDGYREGSPFLREPSVSPYLRAASPFVRATSPFVPETSPAPSYYPRSYYTPPPSYYRASTPPPVVYPYSRVPLYNSRGGYSYRPYNDLYNPSPYLPISAIARDPWWYRYGLRPYTYYPRYPAALRTSYLSPVKNRYLWTRHPMRYL